MLRVIWLVKLIIHEVSICLDMVPMENIDPNLVLKSVWYQAVRSRKQLRLSKLIEIFLSFLRDFWNVKSQKPRQIEKSLPRNMGYQNFLDQFWANCQVVIDQNQKTEHIETKTKTEHDANRNRKIAKNRNQKAYRNRNFGRNRYRNRKFPITTVKPYQNIKISTDFLILIKTRLG